MKHKTGIAISLLLTGTMTIMAGASIAPAMPKIKAAFSDLPNAEILVKQMVTLPAIFIVLFSPIVGKLSDKYGRLPFLFGAFLLYAVTGTSGLYLNSIYSILAGRLLLGLAVAAIMTMTNSLIGDYFEGQERERYLSLQGFATGVGGLLFLVSSGILSEYHWRYPFAIYFFSIPVLVLAYIYLHEPLKKTDEDTNRTPVISYKKHIAILIFFTASVVAIFYFVVPIQGPFLLKKTAGITDSMVGLALGVSTFFASMSALFYRKIKSLLSFKQVFGLNFLLLAIGFLIISYSDSYLMYLIGFSLNGLAVGTYGPNGSLWLLSVTPIHKRGRNMGILSSSLFVGQFLSPLLFQPFLSIIKLQELFLYNAAFLLAFSLLYFYFNYSKKFE